MSQINRPVQKASGWKPQPLAILEKYYKRSIKSVGKAVIVDRAVLAYLSDGGSVDTNFQTYSTEAEHAECLKKWMDKVSKYFDINKSTRMPFGFGYYLLKVLEIDDRKACEAELFAWQCEESLLNTADLLQLIGAVNRESAEVVDHAIQLVEQSSEESKLRARHEIDEAIHALESLRNKI